MGEGDVEGLIVISNVALVVAFWLRVIITFFWVLSLTGLLVLGFLVGLLRRVGPRMSVRGLGLVMFLVSGLSMRGIVSSMVIFLLLINGVRVRM